MVNSNCPLTSNYSYVCMHVKWVQVDIMVDEDLHSFQIMLSLITVHNALRCQLQLSGEQVIRHSMLARVCYMH